ncbi:MAG: peptidoglycan editing factor PgeF [Chloroflexi bacterium]|nr:peptidoglycan editing factor PgeF [Chloroflexota bacterium]MCY3580998.1 peptidoglycan editing factor PgeF [Chloroflexota bacterium]MCY3715439.1 peptidoglycan editing factor PgeF [Chloroflexota bacterium]MDE2651135.1 peptidoglycan editing factor PgeF [Chloroflexota bacterium]
MGKHIERISRSGLTYYRSVAWGGLRHGIFTRSGGVSQGAWSSLNLGASIGDVPQAVRENHARIYAALGVNAGRATSCWLVHSTDVLVVDEAKNGRQLPKADCLITNRPDTPLVMRFADCVPLIAYDPVKRAIGLAHAGWRGTVAGMAARLVMALQQSYSSRPADMEVLIGPAISRRNYPVGEAVAQQAQAYFGESTKVIWRDPVSGAAHFDLWRANRLDLQRQGVGKVQVLDICTHDNTKEFYSHRAEAGRTGRFGVVVSL